MKTTRFRRSTTLRAYSTGAVPHIILDQASQIRHIDDIFGFEIEEVSHIAQQISANTERKISQYYRKPVDRKQRKPDAPSAEKTRLKRRIGEQVAQMMRWGDDILDITKRKAARTRHDASPHGRPDEGKWQANEIDYEQMAKMASSTHLNSENFQYSGPNAGATGVSERRTIKMAISCPALSGSPGVSFDGKDSTEVSFDAKDSDQVSLDAKNSNQASGDSKKSLTKLEAVRNTHNPGKIDAIWEGARVLDL